MPELMGSLSRRVYGHGPALTLATAVLAQLLPFSQLGLPQTVVSDALMATAFGWGLTNAVRRNNLAALRSWPVVAVVIGLTVAFTGALGTPSPVTAIIGLGRIVEIFLIFPLTFLLVIRRKTDLYIVLSALGALWGIQALIGVVQSLSQTGALIFGHATVRRVKKQPLNLIS